MNHDEVRKLLFDLGDSLFPITLESSLSTREAQLVGLQVEPNESRFSFMFGPATQDDLALFNDNFHEAVAGYKVEARATFPALSTNADVFLLSIEALQWSTQELTPIFLHELCHWYIDTGNQARVPIAITKIDENKAKNLHKSTDIQNEHITRHTPQFCKLLCAVARRAVEKKRFGGTRDELVSAAMRFDVNAGYGA